MMCKELYGNAFELAQHRCPRIKNYEYRCPECGKVFNCPANLASHRRWHKPKAAESQNTSSFIENNDSNSSDMMASSSTSHIDGTTSKQSYACNICDKKFRRHSYLRKHLMSHDDAPTTYCCHFCRKTFSSEYSRAQHQITEHSPPKPAQFLFTKSPAADYMEPPQINASFACNYCKYTFVSAYGLSLHLQKFHSQQQQQQYGLMTSQLLQLNRA